MSPYQYTGEELRSIALSYYEHDASETHVIECCSTCMNVLTVTLADLVHNTLPVQVGNVIMALSNPNVYLPTQYGTTGEENENANAG